MLLSVIFSFGLRSEILGTDGAIVINPVSSVKSSPNASGKSLFIIHEGTKVTILEELGEWNKVELSDGRQGWILKREIETIMLTGDNKETANIIANEIGITNVIADVVPSQKVEIIKSLQNDGKIVMMCGDGINDSISLVTSDIGISISSSVP